MKENILNGYKIAKELYKEVGVDVDQALEKLESIPISVNCWQLDDVEGFEVNRHQTSGGIQAIGDHPGKPNNIEEFRAQLVEVLNQIPGKKKVNLHAIYLDSKEHVERNEIEPKHFESWVNFAKQHQIGLDFNPTLFSHPLASHGTLSNNDPKIREFWIEHVKRSRAISEYFGKELGQPSIHNIWLSDGLKEEPIDKVKPRKLIIEALDEILSKKVNKKYSIDALESKLFGLGSEAFVAGSHEFYLNYTAQSDAINTYDMGHFHPTETIHDKLATLLAFDKDIHIHLSRAIRWDSDHVPVVDDHMVAITKEIARQNAFDKVSFSTDCFDASIDRVKALGIAGRSVAKSLLIALLEPIEKLKEYENNKDYTNKLALLEYSKTLPFGLVWQYYCAKHQVIIKD